MWELFVTQSNLEKSQHQQSTVNKQQVNHTNDECNILLLTVDCWLLTLTFVKIWLHDKKLSHVVLLLILFGEQNISHICMWSADFVEVTCYRTAEKTKSETREWKRVRKVVWIATVLMVRSWYANEKCGVKLVACIKRDLRGEKQYNNNIWHAQLIIQLE
jgi:hypothetical protein